WPWYPITPPTSFAFPFRHRSSWPYQSLCRQSTAICLQAPQGRPQVLTTQRLRMAIVWSGKDSTIELPSYPRQLRRAIGLPPYSRQRQRQETCSTTVPLPCPKQRHFARILRPCPRLRQHRDTYSTIALLPCPMRRHFARILRPCPKRRQRLLLAK